LLGKKDLCDKDCEAKGQAKEAEEYAKGGAERIVGEAIADRRRDIFLTTKVSAKNCSYKGVIEAAESSLERMKTTFIDLYLQHWPSSEHQVEETMHAMVYLLEKGLVKYVGVNNFTPKLLEEAKLVLGEHLLANWVIRNEGIVTIPKAKNIDQ
jgi:diketogulonate reductase-like aldo/keto reductase